MEIKICKDVREYRESIFFGLTLRQFVCSIGAVAVAVGLYFVLKSVAGKEIASWVCIVGASPIAIAGFFKYNGLTIEKFVGVWIKSEVFLTGKRLWGGENYYLRIWRRLLNDKNTKKQHSK